MLTVVALVAALLPVRSEPYAWRSVQIEGGGFVTGIITHPRVRDVVFARTDIGGAYRWDARARRWQPLMDWLTRAEWNLYGVESLAVDPADPNRVYVAAGTYDNGWAGTGAILRSSDGGRTWKRAGLPTKLGGNMSGRSIGERMVVDPSDGRRIWFGTRNSGLWRSIDRGATWRRVETFPRVTPAYDAPVPGAGFDRQPPDGYGVGWVLFHGRTLYAGIVRPTRNLYRSADGGRTWKPVPGAPTGMLPHQAKVDGAGVMTVVYCDAPGPNGVNDGAVWQFDLGRGRWTNITPERPGPGNTFGYGGVAVDARRPGTLMVSTLCRWARGDTVFRTTDGGRTWVSLKDRAQRDTRPSPYLKWGRPEADFGHWIGDVEIDPHNPDRAWYVTGATIWTTADLRSADRGEPTHWRAGARGIEETAVEDLVSPPVGAHVISGLRDIAGFAHFDLDRSPPGGMWTNPLLNGTTDLDVAWQRPSRVLRVGTGGGRQHGGLSDDGGRTWRPLAQDPPGGRGAGSAALTADGARVVWRPDGGAAHWTADEGRTWTPCAGAPRGGRVVADPSDAAAVYVLEGGTLYASRDGGASFGPAARGLPREADRLAATYGRTGHLWLPARGAGLLRSVDGGGSFAPVRGVAAAEAVGFGKGARAYPAVYLIGTVSGVQGMFRSDDEGRSWLRIDGPATAFGTASHITGDPKRFGRVYVGTNGRGVLAADPRRAK